MNLSPSPPNTDDDRAIDQSLAHWVLARTGSTLLASAVRAASRAEGLGHACAPLTDPQSEADFDADALAALGKHAWVGDGSSFTPFVLDSRHRFYLWRNWQHETQLAAAILQRCASRRLPIPADVLAADLQLLFADMPAGPTDWQRAAVAAVPGARLFVLTGGPGTGKTTTVLRMLLMLLRHAVACGLPAQPSIALAAPTGKAAQRLAQAIAKGKLELQASLSKCSDDCGSDFSRDAVEKSSRLKSLLQELLQHIPHADAHTLHRLLGYHPRDNSYSHGLKNPLAADIVVVDEASMVDLAMMRQLFDAMRPESVLILLGDPNQLASIDAGSVLADIVSSTPDNRLTPELADRLSPLLQQPLDPSADATPLAGHVITLTHSWRAGSELQRGIEALRGTPDPAWLDVLLCARADGDLRLRQCADSRQLRRCVDDWISGHAHVLQSLLNRDIEAGDALQKLRGMQILCALREGEFGAEGINALFARRLAARFELEPFHTWYHGRPVIITRNDYARGLFNGDVGIALETAQGLRVWFDVSDRDGNIGLRSYSPRALPAHESAWAITIHRSQGSEYQNVAVVLPPDADNRLLCRELVYTAISRARNRSELWCTDDVLRMALHCPIRRHGGLRERLNMSWC